MDWIERRIRKEGGYTIELISEISSYLYDTQDPRLPSFNRNPIKYFQTYYGFLGNLLELVSVTGTSKWKNKKRIHLC